MNILPSLKPGFTFIELIIAIALIGVMAIIVVPNFTGDDLRQARQTMVQQLNNLVATAQYEALISQKITRVVLDLKKLVFLIEVQTEQKNSTGDFLYELISADYNQPSLLWNRNFKILAIDINEKNSLLDTDDKVWFYIMPDGNTQSVKIKFTDLKANEKYDEITSYNLVLNPFLAQFKLT